MKKLLAIITAVLWVAILALVICNSWQPLANGLIIFGTLPAGILWMCWLLDEKETK